MSKFRIVEERDIKLLENQHVIVPIYYVEIRCWFILWWVWQRYSTSYDNLDNAIAFMNALVEANQFKTRVITS